MCHYLLPHRLSPPLLLMANQVRGSNITIQEHKRCSGDALYARRVRALSAYIQGPIFVIDERATFYYNVRIAELLVREIWRKIDTGGAG